MLRTKKKNYKLNKASTVSCCCMPKQSKTHQLLQYICLAYVLREFQYKSVHFFLRFETLATGTCAPGPGASASGSGRRRAQRLTKSTCLDGHRAQAWPAESGKGKKKKEHGRPSREKEKKKSMAGRTRSFTRRPKGPDACFQKLPRHFPLGHAFHTSSNRAWGRKT